MADLESKFDALCGLARLLGADADVLAEVALAWNEPERYVAEYAKRLGERGIDTPIPGLAFIALVDALRAQKRCEEIDWRADTKRMLQAVRALLRSAKHEGWKAPKLDHSQELPALLRVVGSSLEASGLVLGQLDHASDSYALVVLRPEQGELATELARRADVGRFAVWRLDGVVKPPPPLRLRTVEVIEAGGRLPPAQVIVLPGRRLVTCDGRTLSIVRSDGAMRVAFDATLVPDFDPQATPPQHVLFRSGQGFGVVSRQFVRVWSPQGDSVLYRNDPPLGPNARGAFAAAVRGGISDDPAVVVGICHRASVASEEVHPVVLRLDPKHLTASFGELTQDGRLGEVRRDRLPMSSAMRLDAKLRRAVQLQAIAWLDDALFVVASSRQESPSYAVYARYHAPFGQLEQLIDLGGECEARVSSSRAHLLVSYLEPAGRRSLAYSLAHVTRPPTPIELPDGAVLLDHEDGAFWYFEPHDDRGRYVLAEPQ